MKHKSFQTQDDPFAKNAQGTSKIYHEVLLLMKNLQTKSQVKNMIYNYYDSYNTVVKSRDDNEIVNDNEDDYITFNDNKTLKNYISNKPRETILK